MLELAVYAVAVVATMLVVRAWQRRQKPLPPQLLPIRLDAVPRDDLADWDRRMQAARTETISDDDPALPVVLEQAASRGWDGDT